MSLDAIYHHKYYKGSGNIQAYHLENELGVFKNVKVIDQYRNYQYGVGLNIDYRFLKKDYYFTIRITTHRIIFNYENGFETNLEIPMQDFRSYEIKEGNLFSKGYLNLTLKDHLMKLETKNLKELGDALNGSSKAKTWEFAKPQTETPVYSGLSGIKSQYKAEVQQTKAIVVSSTADVDSLVKKFEKLKDVINELKKNTKNNEDTNEIDEILSNIGQIDIVTKDESGRRFYDELAQNIYMISKELLSRYGGVVSLVDIFWILNEKRKISLVSASDLIQACKRFESLNLPIKLIEVETEKNKMLKVIQYANFNSDEDFKNNVAKHIDKELGITAEQLARRSKIPLLVAYSKLNLALNSGKVILDDGLEGKKYFLNFILHPYQFLQVLIL